VIESMKRLPPEKNKILVLEGSVVDSDWRLGMLHNDFARRLRDLEPLIREVPNLWVMNGCDVDQRCWISEGLGRTAFAHFLIEGIRGQAGGSSGRLTLAGLHRYVRTRVSDWAWHARGAVQEPLLLPMAESAEAGSRGTGAERVELAVVGGSQGFESFSPPDLEDVQRSWKTYQELDGLVPHPRTYSPRRWGEYRALLVRQEELIRAGAVPEQTRPIASRLEVLEEELRGGRFLDRLPQSSENNLVMNVVLGGQLTSRPAEQQEFLRFWAPPSESDSSKIWAAIKEAGGGTESEPTRSLRSRIDDFILERTAGDPARGLKIAANRLALTRGELPQPAEAHFVIMLNKDLGSSPERPARFWSLVGRGIQLRRRAERAALGIGDMTLGHVRSEELVPWIRSAIERGDEKRRLGEDQLLSSEPAAWAQAETDQLEAERHYGEALKRASRVRAAAAARDRVLADLPFFGRWLAHQQPEDLDKGDFPAMVSELWRQTHALADQLEIPRDDVDLGPLEQAERAVNDGFGQVLSRFRGQIGELSRDRSAADWEVAMATAAVPFEDSRDQTMRKVIWDRLAAIARHDQEVASKSPAARLSATDREQSVLVARKRAQLQGLMAVAALGPGGFGETAPGEPASAEPTLRRLRSPIEDSGETDRPWWREIAQAGDQIGSRWRRLVAQADALAAHEGSTAEFQAFQARLRKADRLARQCGGGMPGDPVPKVEAAALYRQTRVHDLLLWMAERTWRDHWYDEDPRAGRPYYLSAAARYLNDARALFPESPDVPRVQEKVERKDRLLLIGPPRIVLTSEPSREVAYRIAAEGDPPTGLPVVRPRVEGDLRIEGESPGFRSLSWPAGGNFSLAVFSPRIRSAAEDRELTVPTLLRAGLTLEGRFRGQEFVSSTEFEIHPLPDQVAIGPPPRDPPQASLAVRASGEVFSRFGEGTGAIAIVLDCSGSMLQRMPSGRSKFDDAKTALLQVLSLVPKGTRVSLWTFSQLPKDAPDPTVNDPIVLEPERTIRPLRLPAPWDRSQVPELSRQLDQIRPFLETPLVQAMWTAATRDLKDARGLKTLVVLTDGDDTRLHLSTSFNPNRLDVPSFIAEYFKPLGVQVNMVFFTAMAKPTELENAKRNFEKPLRMLDPPGSYVEAKDLDQLVATLRRAIRQRLVCQIVRPNGTAVGEEPLEVSRPGEEDRWWLGGLEPGIYKLRLVADRTYEREVDLRQGDRMLVRLVETQGGGIGFERALYSDDFPDRLSEDRGGWRLSALDSVLTKEQPHNRLDLLAAIERLPSEAGGSRALEQVQPGFVWIQLAAQDLSDPVSRFTVRWRERIFYPGPVWHLDVPDWPADPAGDRDARPVLRAWWLPPGERPSGLKVVLSPGERPGPIRLEEGELVQIESLGVETHRVEVRPGELAEKSCLVVRLSHPRNRPFLVDPMRLTGLENQAVGYEHRFYSRAGSYTGLFWPLNEPQLERLKDLTLIALDRQQEDAERRNTAGVLMLPLPRSPGRLPAAPTVLLR
jgi:hypothetical protein